MSEREGSVVELASTLTNRHWSIAQGLIDGNNVTFIARSLGIGVVMGTGLKADIAVRMGDSSSITPGICKAIVCGIALGRLDASGLKTQPNSLLPIEVQFMDLMFRGAKEDDIAGIMGITKSSIASMCARVPKKMGLYGIYSAVAWVAWQQKLSGRLDSANLDRLFLNDSSEKIQ